MKVKQHEASLFFERILIIRDFKMKDFETELYYNREK